ncbi:hypothetical protein SPI_01077 [Niveomyces insectorum RCEF 264]|uniref:Uncharacterized protein n=1 Tax=Niveomyces insectorum RCEF 264 TaxID=1081102 RepID=A0A167YN79_9HYPO|nr:hypothetical protein SPI_01077 [Niveomyces insectorum RCEF 264]
MTTSSAAERTPMLQTLGSVSSGADTPSNLSSSQPQGQQTATQLFDYASFMWDGTDTWQQMILDVERGVNLDAHITASDYQNQSLASQNAACRSDYLTHAPSELSTMSETSPQATSGPIVQNSSADNHRLINYFTHAVTPPILSEVEAQKNWITMRKLLTKMAGDSRMVRWAVLAFSNVMLCRREGGWMASQQNHYENAAAEVAFCDQETESLVPHSPRRENLLAALFFLSYVDILEARVEAARAYLKQAYNIFQAGQKRGFSPIEKQLFLWIRLLDARVVSAGGDGFFLSRDNEELFVQSSPASLGGEDDETHKTDVDDGDVEDALFHALYQPGIVFFQKVQSFMGHIAKIDPWHRSRGTVEDETEVMGIAAAIAADLRALYEQRPSLMDYAVAGKLTAPHISATLAFNITRAFRTYLSNYYASKIHLHRVAYKSFPLTSEAVEAMNHIRHLAKLIAEGLDGDDPLPINMLWPLLLLGTEEQDASERAWIRAQLLRMEKIAGNAKITAQVLEELQRRQDASKARVDIGTVMREIFNMRFAIV